MPYFRTISAPVGRAFQRSQIILIVQNTNNKKNLYVNLIIKAGHIITGWTKVLLERLGLRSFKADEKRLSDLRLQLCGRCKHVTSKKVLAFVNGEDKWESALFCTVCKCPCLEKSLVASEKCPLGYW